MVEADATVTEDGRQGHEDVDGLPPTEVAAWALPLSGHSGTANSGSP